MCQNHFCFIHHRLYQLLGISQEVLEHFVLLLIYSTSPNLARNRSSVRMMVTILTCLHNINTIVRRHRMDIKHTPCMVETKVYDYFFNCLRIVDSFTPINLPMRASVQPSFLNRTISSLSF